MLWVTRKDGRRQSLPLPGPAAARIGADLASRADLKDVPAPPERLLAPGRAGHRSPPPPEGGCSPRDVMAGRAPASASRGGPAGRSGGPALGPQRRCVSRSQGCTSTRAGQFATCRPRWGMPSRVRPADTTGPGTPPAVLPATWSPPAWPPREARAGGAARLARHAATAAWWDIAWVPPDFYTPVVPSGKDAPFELGTDGPRSILVGIDGSATAARAGWYAAGLAHRQGARVTAVFVARRSAGPGEAMAAPPPGASPGRAADEAPRGG